MIICYCPQCGKKAEDEFNFCPYCGLKFPREEATECEASPGNKHAHQSGNRTSGTYSPEDVSVRIDACCSPSTKAGQSSELPSCSPKAYTKSGNIETRLPSITGNKKQMERNSARFSRPPLKRKLICTPEKNEEKKDETSPVKPEIIISEISPRAKRAKNVQLQPLPTNLILTDNSNTEWMLAKLLAEEKTWFYYEVYAIPKSKEECRILKLDDKDGRIYNEQNFFQRAAKKMTVDKWKKLHDCPALGIPTCIGFGVKNLYRFLVFSALGQNLQTFINKNRGQLSEIAVCQIVCRMIDVLEYVHENEYVHGDIIAENIYVSSNYQEVYLAGYYNAFRFCPGGNHVAYRQGSRTPHEGTAEFISLDVHHGTGPTRRSDLESLGYCMLKWLSGTLPWSNENNPFSMMKMKMRFKTDVPELLKKCFICRTIPDLPKVYLGKIFNLNYEERPDYHGIRNDFLSVLQRKDVRPYDPVQL